MSKTQPKTVPTESIHKVQAFIDVKDRIDAFRAKHYEVFKGYEHLIDEYNTTLEDAEKEVRSLGVNCGPFQTCGEQTKVDVNKLYDELGENNFLKVGGMIETRRVLDIDKAKFEALVESDSIPKEIVESCWARTTRYKAPHRVKLP